MTRVPIGASIREILGSAHRDPVPLGVRIGSLIYSSGITGADLETGRVSQDLDQQFDAAFQSMRALVERAGATVANIAHVTFFLKDLRDRVAINRPWLEMFPDEDDRPTYKFMGADLLGDRLVQLQVLAVAGARREMLNISGIAHGNPIPMGVKIGSWVFTSRILPADPATGKNGEGPEEQARLAFQNVRRLLALAGATAADITQIWVFVKDPSYAQAVLSWWGHLFGATPSSLVGEGWDGGERSGPVSHIVQVDLPGNLLVMAEFTALSDPRAPQVGASRSGEDSQLAVTEILGSPDRDPIPLGVRIGPIVYGPRLIGMDLETGKLGDGLDDQLALAFRNMRTLVERAGGSTDNIAHVTLFMRDLSERQAFNRHWVEMFPDEHDRPPFKYMPADLASGVLAQLQAFAVVGGRRRVLEIPGVAHRDPMPLAVRIGDMVFSSRIMGTDPATGSTPATPEEQAQRAFSHLVNLVEQAGGSPAHVTQVAAFLTDQAYVGAIDAPWRQTFPEDGGRPILHPMVVSLPGPQVRLEFIARLPEA